MTLPAALILGFEYNLFFLLPLLFINRFDCFSKVSRFFGHVVSVAKFSKLSVSSFRIATGSEQDLCMAFRT